MSAVFKASVKLTAEHIRAFYDEFLKKKIIHLYIISIILFILSVYVTVQFFRFFFVYHLLFPALLGLFILPAAFSISKNMIAGIIGIRKARNPDIPDEICSYTFDGNGFCMLVRREGYSSELNIGYQEIKRAVENENYFFILLENGTAIIGKNDLTEGTPDELRTFLHYKMGERFEVNIY